MLKDPLADAYSSVHDDEQNEEKNNSGFLIWGVWVVMTIISVTVLTVSIISLIFFSKKMDSTYQTFLQSTLMLAPNVFNLDGSRIPPPLEMKGNDWGIMDSIMISSMSTENEYYVVDSEATNKHNKDLLTEYRPAEAFNTYEMGYKLNNGDISYVKHQLQSEPTFSISGLKNLLMRVNKYPQIPTDEPVKPIILQHVAYANVKNVAGTKDTFDICYDSNCHMNDNYVVAGQKIFSVVGWNDNILSLGMIDGEGNTKVFEGGFICRMPKQETGHTIGYFTGNFSDTMEQTVCPNIHLPQNWEPRIIEASHYETILKNSMNTKENENKKEKKYYQRIEIDKETQKKLNEETKKYQEQIKQRFELKKQSENDNNLKRNNKYSSLKNAALKEPTPLKLRESALEAKGEDGIKYVDKFNLKSNYIYYITATKTSYPRYTKSYGKDIFDIILLVYDKTTDETVFTILEDVCDELLVKLFEPEALYHDLYLNGEECNYMLLPYETLLKMNLNIRPTKVIALGNSYMSYDFIYYDNKLDGTIPSNVQKRKYNERLTNTDLLFFSNN